MKRVVSSRWFGWLSIFILLVAFWLRVHDLARADFWTDEAVSIQHVRTQSLSTMIDSLARNEAMPPLYFMGLRLWRGFGESEFFLRFLSVFYGITSVALMAVLGRRLLGREAGLLGAAIFALSSMHITLSQWARPYALAICIAIGLLLVALELGRNPSLRGWAVFWVLAATAMFTLYVLGTMLLGTGLYIWYKRRRLGLTQGLGPVAAVGLGTLAVFSPWLPIVLHQSTWAPKALWWVPPPQPRILLETLDQFLLGVLSRQWLSSLAAAFVISSIVVLLFLGIYRAWKAGRLSFVLLTAGFPLALIWIVSYWSPVYHPRHVAFALPGMVLLLVEGILTFKRVPRSAFAIVLLGASLVAQAAPLYQQGDVIPWSRVAEWIASRARTGDLVVFSPPFQQPAFDIKYDGPPLETRGIREYETYVHQPDAVFDVYIPLSAIKGWVKDRPSFWLLEDTRWPTSWGEWEYQGSLKAKFLGLRVYLFERRVPTNEGEPSARLNYAID